MTTHDYATETILAGGIDFTDVLVGQSGGLSAIYSIYWEGNTVTVETEHGTLIFRQTDTVEVLAQD